MVVAVSDSLQTPVRAILELLGDIETHEVVCLPRKRRHTVCSVGLKHIEARCNAKGEGKGSFPEASPLYDSVILVYGLSEVEAEGRVGVHVWSLYEGLELVARMGWRSLKPNDALDRLLSEHWIAKSACNMWELLVVSPLYLVLVSFVVIVVSCCWAILESLLMV